MHHKCHIKDNMPTDPAIQTDEELRKTTRSMLACAICLRLQLGVIDKKFHDARMSNDVIAMDSAINEAHDLNDMLHEVNNYIEKCSEEILKRMPEEVRKEVQEAEKMLMFSMNAHNN